MPEVQETTILSPSHIGRPRESTLSPRASSDLPCLGPNLGPNHLRKCRRYSQASQAKFRLQTSLFLQWSATKSTPQYQVIWKKKKKGTQAGRNRVIADQVVTCPLVRPRAGFTIQPGVDSESLLASCIMASQLANYEIFREQLSIRYPSYGHALWEPSPRIPKLGPSPVQVGDVGFILER